MNKKISALILSFYSVFISHGQIKVSNLNNGDVKIGSIENEASAKLDIEGRATVSSYIFKASDIDDNSSGFFSVNDGTNNPSFFIPTFTFKPSNSYAEGVGGFFISEISDINDLENDYLGGMVISSNKNGVFNSQVSNINLLTVRNANLPVFTIKSNGIIRFNNYGSGTLTTDADGNISVSDGRLKTIIKPLESGLEKVMKLNPVLYKWKEGSGFNSEFSELGFIAQEVKKIIPEAVLSEESFTSLLNFSDRAILAVLVRAIQEQQQLINELNEIVSNLNQ